MPTPARRRKSAPAGSERAARSSTCRSTNGAEFMVVSQGLAAADRRAIDAAIRCSACASSPTLSAATCRRRRRRARIDSARRRSRSGTTRCAPRQREAVRKGWDDRPITPARLVSELWDAVKNKNWLLAVRNQSSFPEGIWEFAGAGQYLGPQRRRRRRLRAGRGGRRGDREPQRRSTSASRCSATATYVMSASAIWSAVHYRAPMLAIINNNTTWGNDEKHQIEVAGDRKPAASKMPGSASAWSIPRSTTR